MDRVRILHGTGTGILRTLIRQYLSTVPDVYKRQAQHRNERLLGERGHQRLFAYPHEHLFPGTG